MLDKAVPHVQGPTAVQIDTATTVLVALDFYPWVGDILVLNYGVTLLLFQYNPTIAAGCRKHITAVQIGELEYIHFEPPFNRDKQHPGSYLGAGGGGGLFVELW